MPAFIANTNVLDLVGLKSEIENVFINDATVTVTVKNAAGVNVTGATWPLAMTYVAASNGNYRAILASDLPFAKENYTAFINADGGVDRKGHWEFTFKPLPRTSKDGE